MSANNVSSHLLCRTHSGYQSAVGIVLPGGFRFPAAVVSGGGDRIAVKATSPSGGEVVQ
jgi:hypothetical protein